MHKPGVDPGICVCPSPLFPLRSRVPLKPARPKTNLVHSKAMRKPLVAIILKILKCMFYSCHLSGVPWRHRSVAQREGQSWLGSPLNPPQLTHSNRHECMDKSSKQHTVICYQDGQHASQYSRQCIYSPMSGLNSSSTISWKNSLETPPSSMPCSPSNSTNNCFLKSCGFSNATSSSWSCTTFSVTSGLQNKHRRSPHCLYKQLISYFNFLFQRSPFLFSVTMPSYCTTVL